MGTDPIFRICERFSDEKNGVRPHLLSRYIRKVENR
jgi:hypothetical protein